MPYESPSQAAELRYGALEPCESSFGSQPWIAEDKDLLELGATSVGKAR
jgi:hypothetical protein